MAETQGPEKIRVGFGLRWRFTLYLSGVTLLVMGLIAVIVSREIRKTLDAQIKERGLALARNLADSCVEPMQLKDERTLALMMLVKEYVQTGGGLEARAQLLERQSLASRVSGYLVRLGQEQVLEGIRNEGLVTTLVVDPTGRILAFADAFVEQQDWLAKLDQPYQPDPGTGLLSPGEEFHVWTSQAKGLYVLAVPVVASAGTGPASAGSSPAAGSPAAGTPAFYGAVYLSVSQGLVDRTVAAAIAFLMLMAGGLVVLGAVSAIALAGVLTNPIRQLTKGVQAIAAGDFNMRVNLKRADELGELTDAFNQMAKGLAERELMRGAFSAYVSKDLLAEIIKNPDAMKLGGSRKEGTVMFTFFGNHHELPALMARLDPEAFVRVINDYLELQATLVFEHKGHLDKFVGEEVVAVWGATTPVEDHALWAAKCASAIASAVTELNQRRERQGLMTTQISIGINSGSMVAGNMGSADGKRDYTVISADVNFAARLAGAGAEVHGGEIWVGESTYNLIKGSVELREKRMVEFKGILEPQPVYILAGLKAAAAAR